MLGTAFYRLKNLLCILILGFMEQRYGNGLENAVGS